MNQEITLEYGLFIEKFYNLYNPDESYVGRTINRTFSMRALKMIMILSN